MTIFFSSFFAAYNNTKVWLSDSRARLLSTSLCYLTISCSGYGADSEAGAMNPIGLGLPPLGGDFMTSSLGLASGGSAAFSHSPEKTSFFFLDHPRIFSNPHSLSSNSHLRTWEHPASLYSESLIVGLQLQAGVVVVVVVRQTGNN